MIQGVRYHPLLAFLLLAGSQPDPVTAFRDVTVIPMDTERVVEHQTVLVRGDRIAALGPTGSIAIPADANVVEGSGKFLMPGLVDMHVHLPGDTSAATTRNALTLFVSNGVTRVRVLNGNARHLRVRDSVARGDLLGPRMYVVGAATGALPDNTADMRRLLSPQEVARFTEGMKRAGFDFIQVNATLMKSEYDELVNTARKTGIRLSGSVPNDVGLARVTRAKQASIENLEGYLEPLERDDSPIRLADPVTRARRLLDYYDEAKLGKLTASLRSAGIANTPMLFITHVGATQQAPESLAAWPEMKYMPPRTVAAWIRGLRRTQEQAPEADRVARFLAFRNRVTKALSDGKALVLVGSDANQTFVVPGYGTLYEIHSLTVAGLTRYEAIRAATANAAEFMGAANEFGTIAPGRVADLVLLDGNPLDDIGNLTLRAGVMLPGTWRPADTLGAALRRIAESYQAQP